MTIAAHAGFNSPTTVPLAPTQTVRSFVAGSLASSGRNRQRRPIEVTFPESVSAEHKSMMVAAVREINSLREMPAGWDGENADPITDSAAIAAIQMVNRFATSGRLRVQIFPLFGGGLQLEWAAWGDRVECEIESNGSVFIVCVSVYAPRGPIEREGASPYSIPDIGPVLDFLAEMSTNLGR